MKEKQMGTNYYLLRKTCPSCKREESKLHIGKSSCSWAFSLHVYPEKMINDLPDWIDLFEDENNIIQDEYGKIISTVDLLKTIIIREICDNKPLSRYNDKSCINHGPTWDCIDAEFS